MMELDVFDLVIIFFVAVLAPVVNNLPFQLKLPIIVIEILLGLIIGPQVLNLVTINPLLSFLSNLGLAFLFFIAGLEIDLAKFKGRPLTLAIKGWLLSLGLAFLLANFLHLIGFIRATPLVTIALCTTALGVLIPIMRDGNQLNTKLGKFILAAGVMGEFGPIVLISIIATHGRNNLVQGLLLISFTIITIVSGIITLYYQPKKIRKFLHKAITSSSQLPIRLSILILFLLVYLASKFGFDIIIGAFAAGMIVSLATKNDNYRELLHHKIDSIGFGFFIPIFFICTGIKFDLITLTDSFNGLMKMLVFLGLLLLVRGLPVLLYRRDLANNEQGALVFFSATALPLIVAITEIGIQTKTMLPENAPALIGAGMISVMFFPLIGLILKNQGKL